MRGWQRLAGRRIRQNEFHEQSHYCQLVARLLPNNVALGLMRTMLRIMNTQIHATMTLYVPVRSDGFRSLPHRYYTTAAFFIIQQPVQTDWHVEIVSAEPIGMPTGKAGDSMDATHARLSARLDELIALTNRTADLMADCARKARDSGYMGVSPGCAWDGTDLSNPETFQDERDDWNWRMESNCVGDRTDLNENE